MKNRDAKALVSTTLYYSSYSPSLLLLISYVIQKSRVQDHNLQDQDQGEDQDQGQYQDHDQGILERRKKNSRHNGKFKLKTEVEDINSRIKGNAP